LPAARGGCAARLSCGPPCPLEAGGGELVRGAGPREQPRPLGHGEELAAPGGEPLELGGQPLGGELAIRDQHRSSRAHEILSVVGLVVVDARRVRHEDGADPHRGELRHGEAAGSALISARTGLPLTGEWVLCPKLPGKPSSTCRARCARMRLVKPAMAFCSWIRSGRRVSQAASPPGPVTKPPRPTTTTGR